LDAIIHDKLIISLEASWTCVIKCFSVTVLSCLWSQRSQSLKAGRQGCVLPCGDSRLACLGLGYREPQLTNHSCGQSQMSPVNAVLAGGCVVVSLGLLHRTATSLVKVSPGCVTTGTYSFWLGSPTLSSPTATSHLCCQPYQQAWG
jgi:hypothetical protein